MSDLTDYLDDLIKAMEATWAQLPVAEVFRHAQPIPLAVSADSYEGTRHIKDETRTFTSPEDAVEAALRYPFRGRRVIILFGGPGAGKTSAMKWLARHFALQAKGRLADPAAPIPVHVELPALNTKDGWQELLAGIRQRQPPCINPKPTLWLLDGLDAVAGSSVSPGYLLDTLTSEQTLSAGDSCIVASRELTEVTGAIDRWPLSQRLSLKPLDRTQRKLWIAKYCPDATIPFEQFIAGHKKAAGFLDTPLLFAMFLSAVVDSQKDQRPFDCDKYSGPAGLFEGFTRYAIRRAVELGRLSSDAADDAALDYVEEAWWAALKGGHEDRFEVREASRLARQASGIDWTTEEQYLFDRGVRILTEAGLTVCTGGKLLAPHQQFAEFWAARHLATRLLRAVEGDWLEAELWDHYEEDRLDPVTGQALAICAVQSLRNDNVTRSIALLKDRYAHSVPGIWYHVGAPIALEPLIDLVQDKNADYDAWYGAAKSLGRLGDRKAVQPLIDLAQDKSAGDCIRSDAMTALGMLGDPRAILPLVASLQDKNTDASVRLSAANALGTLGNPMTIQPLIDLLEGKGVDAYIRYCATRALAALGAPRAMEHFVALLKDKNADRYARDYAADALGTLGDRRAVPLLIASLQDKNADESTRNGAALALGMLGDLTAFQPLIELLQNEKADAQVRCCVARSLGMLGDRRAVQPFTALLQDKNADSYVRHRAIDALGMLGDPRIIRLLIEFLQDKSENESSRLSAALTLNALGDRTAVQPLIALLQDKDTDYHTRICARLAFRALGDRSAVQPLIALVQDKSADDTARFCAAEVLGGLGDRRAIQPLFDYLQDKRAGSNARLKTVLALGMLGDPRAFQPLIDIMHNKHASSIDRRQAAATLRKLGDPRTVGALIVVLQDKGMDEFDRIIPAEALGCLGDPRAFRPLIDFLQDTKADGVVRRWAADALAELGRGGHPGVLDQMADAHVPWDLQRNVAERLGRRAIPPEWKETVRAQRKTRIHTQRKENSIVVQMNGPVFNQCILNIESNLQNVRQQIVGTNRNSDEVRKTIADLEQALKATPPEHSEKAEAISLGAKTLSEQAFQSRPNGTFMEITKKGMVEAAEALAAVVPTVLPLVKKLTELIIGNDGEKG